MRSLSDKIRIFKIVAIAKSPTQTKAIAPKSNFDKLRSAELYIDYFLVLPESFLLLSLSILSPNLTSLAGFMNVTLVPRSFENAIARKIAHVSAIANPKMLN